MRATDWLKRMTGAARRVEEPAAEEPASMLYTTRTYPIYYLSITKCGCTFLKSLLYALDFGEEHPDGIHLHRKERGLIRADDIAPETVRASPYAFVVLRDPATRYVSFYLDKIWGEGPTNFPEIRDRLEADGVVDLARDLDVEGHRANVMRLLEWTSRSLAGEPEEVLVAGGRYHHWRAQTGRLRRARHFPLTHLTLEGLDWQLPLLLKPVIPDLAERMAAVTERNRSPRPVPLREIADEATSAAIRARYQRDARLHARATGVWAGQQRVRRLPDPPLRGHLRCTRAGGFVLRGAAASGRSALAAALGGGALVDVARDALRGGVVLVREPLERFVAFYLHVFLQEGDPGWTRLRDRLTATRGFQPEPGEDADHAENLRILSIYMGRRAESFAGIGGPDGSRAQVHEVRKPLDWGMMPLLVQGGEVRSGSATPMAPDDPLRAVLARTALPPNWRDWVSAAVADRFRTMYRADFELYEALSRDGAAEADETWDDANPDGPSTAG